MSVKLTARSVKNAQPGNRVYNVHDTEISGFVLRVQPSGKKAFYLRGRVTYPDRSRGPQRYYHIGDANTLTPAQARHEAQRLAGMLADGEDPDAAKRSDKAATLGELIDGPYKQTVLEHRRSGQATYARLKSCFGFLWDRSLDDQTLVQALTNWQAQRLKDGKSPVTINRDVSALHAALTFAVDQGLTSAQPLSRLKPIKLDSRRGVVRYLSPEEEARLWGALEAREERIRAERDNANAWRRERGYPELLDLRAVAYADRLKPLVILALNTGLRRGELFGLEWGDVDFGRAMLSVRGAVAKTGATRYVPLNKDAFEAMTGWHAQGSGQGYVFPGKDGGRLDNIKTSWTRLMKEAGIQNFRFHDCRHDFASKLVMAGIDLNTVRELLGHSDLKMTLRYAHLAPHKMAEAVARLNFGGDNIVPMPRASEQTD